MKLIIEIKDGEPLRDKLRDIIEMIEDGYIVGNDWEIVEYD